MPKSSGVGVSRARSREICVCTSSPAPPLLHLYPAPILARHPMLAILDSCKDDTLLLEEHLKHSLDTHPTISLQRLYQRLVTSIVKYFCLSPNKCLSLVQLHSSSNAMQCNAMPPIGVHFYLRTPLSQSINPPVTSIL